MRILALGFRFLFILWSFAGAFCAYGWRRLTLRVGHLSPTDRTLRVDRLRGEVLAELLERLGATFVKFGQILSTRPDLLPPGLIESLSRLQDQVPPLPFEVVLRVLDESLDPTVRARLSHIEPAAVAAASVAQVHRGRLDTGESVAVKVQRPKAPMQIERDLVLMQMVARMLDYVPTVRMLSLPGSVERFSEAMRGQLDFRLEARNNRRFAENFREFEGLEVPALYEDLCTSRVLVMAFVDGVRATEPEKVGGDRAKLARIGAECMLKMVFEDGFVHADLHPGNIMLTEDKVVLLDLGLVATIPPDFIRPWCQTLMALAQQDGHAVARLFYSYAPSVGRTDYRAFEADICRFFDKYYGRSLGEVEVSQVISGAMNILRKHHVQIDPVLTVVNIGLLVAEGLGKQLDPSLNLVTHALPYLTNALVKAPPPRAPLRELPAA